MSQTERERERDSEEEIPVPISPGRSAQRRSGSQSASSTSPHNPAHSPNSIIQLSFPAKPMLEYGSWGHFGQQTATRFEEEEGGEEDLADAGGRRGHVSLRSTGCTSAARPFSRLRSAHALSITSPHLPFHLFPFSPFLPGTAAASDTVQFK